MIHRNPTTGNQPPRDPPPKETEDLPEQPSDNQ